MTKHEHYDDCPWCQERARREQDDKRMNAMANAFRELLDCNFNSDEAIDAITDKLCPHAIDAYDVLLIAAKISQERANKFNTVAEEWFNEMEFASNIAIAGETIQ